MPIVSTGNFKRAQGLTEMTFIKTCEELAALGYIVEDGGVIPKRQSDGADMPTAQRLLANGVPPISGGNYSVNFDPVPLDLTGAEATLPILSVEGNKIKQNGVDFIIRGLSVAECGNETTNFTVQTRLARQLSKFPQCNTVRFPCQPSHISTYGLSDYLTYWVDPLVRWCEINNLYCIIDWHRIDRWDNADTDFKAFWDVVGPRYKDLPHVIYELFNEPTDPYSDGQAGWDNFKTPMQVWVDRVRGFAPDTLFLVGSPVWSQLTRWIPQNPIDDVNTAYVHHIYPGHLPGGSVLNFQGNPVADETIETKNAWMDTNFGNAMATIPVVFTEWGYALTDVGFYLLQAKSRESFAEPLLNYLAAKGASAGWTAWSLDPLNGPAMQNTDETLNDFGLFVKTALGG